VGVVESRAPKRAKTGLFDGPTVGTDKPIVITGAQGQLPTRRNGCPRNCFTLLVAAHPRRGAVVFWSPWAARSMRPATLQGESVFITDLARRRRRAVGSVTSGG